MIDKRAKDKRTRLITKALSFERTLHRWQPWLDSVVEGRKVLYAKGTHPSLHKMRSVVSTTLTNLDFPSCTLLELYWLCCVFCDYWTKGGFMFEKLVPPEWFPFPFGFDSEHLLYDFKGKRIYPPDVWDKDDRKFWFEREPLTQSLRPERRAEYFQDYPNKEFYLMLPSNHPVRKKTQRGRPITKKIDGETILE